jgi:hypothetical protein
VLEFIVDRKETIQGYKISFFQFIIMKDIIMLPNPKGKRLLWDKVLGGRADMQVSEWGPRVLEGQTCVSARLAESQPFKNDDAGRETT